MICEYHRESEEKKKTTQRISKSCENYRIVVAESASALTFNHISQA